jgi:hypothetical protein
MCTFSPSSSMKAAGPRKCRFSPWTTHFVVLCRGWIRQIHTGALVFLAVICSVDAQTCPNAHAWHCNCYGSPWVRCSHVCGSQCGGCYEGLGSQLNQHNCQIYPGYGGCYSSCACINRPGGSDNNPHPIEGVNHRSFCASAGFYNNQNQGYYRVQPCRGTGVYFTGPGDFAGNCPQQACSSPPTGKYHVENTDVLTSDACPSAWCTPPQNGHYWSGNGGTHAHGCPTRECLNTPATGYYWSGHGGTDPTGCNIAQCTAVEGRYFTPQVTLTDPCPTASCPICGVGWYRAGCLRGPGQCYICPPDSYCPGDNNYYPNPPSPPPPPPPPSPPPPSPPPVPPGGSYESAAEGTVTLDCVLSEVTLAVRESIMEGLRATLYTLGSSVVGVRITGVTSEVVARTIVAYSILLESRASCLQAIEILSASSATPVNLQRYFSNSPTGASSASTFWATVRARERTDPRELLSTRMDAPLVSC